MTSTTVRMRQALTGTALSAMLASILSVFSLGLLFSYGVQYALPATGLDVSALQLLVFHDEDVEIYFNGVLAARAGGFVRFC